MTAHDSYSPGLHKLLTLKVDVAARLTDVGAFLMHTAYLLEKFELEKVGESFFVFDNGSFTAAICLKESHICIHTWPEFGQLTMDIYLCNYLQDNSEKVNLVAGEYINYFEAEIIREFDINR